jgi:hypothetical protein
MWLSFLEGRGEHAAMRLLRAAPGATPPGRVPALPGPGPRDPAVEHAYCLAHRAMAAMNECKMPSGFHDCLAPNLRDRRLTGHTAPRRAAR